MKNNLILIAGGALFREGRGGKKRWLIVKQGKEDKWELPKVIVRRGESSVRASLRMMGEQAGLGTKVLEEAGRVNDSIAVGGKKTKRKHLYYLMVQKTGGEILGFEDFAWLEYEKAIKKLDAKKEVQILRQAYQELKKWLKKREPEK